MFTGIVEERGEVRHVARRGDIRLFTVSAREALEGMTLGDSISVSGVCLTVVDFGENGFTVEATPETMRTTNLGELASGSVVNLERPVRLGGKMGGHLVSGHVDGTGRIVDIRREGESYVIAFQVPEHLMRYIVPKGSVAVEGISLTVVETQGDRFTVAIIPFTYRETTISQKRVGSVVNIECDVIGKYVERLLAGYATRDAVGTDRVSGIDREFLLRHGFI